MSSNIIFNKKNIVNFENGNNKFVYEFPKDISFSKGDTVAISHLNIYFSWFNISAKYNNNKFFYKWWDLNGDLTVINEVVIPDGYYDVNMLYEFLQSFMVSKGHFLTTLTGNYVHFIELITNSTYYSVSFRLNSVSEQMDFGNGLEQIENNCELPTTWKIPSTFQTPEIIIPSNNEFGTLLGFSAGSLYKDLTVQPASNEKYTFSNDMSPNLLPSSSYIMTCSLVDNELSIPNNVIYSFTIPNNVGFGDLISPTDNIVFSKIKEGRYKEVALAIYDQDFNPLQILDPNLLIVLSVQKK